MHKQNLHTHTNFCDGKNTPEEMVLAAIEQGFDSLGFSGHSWMPFAPEYAMSLADTKAYEQELLRLKQAYAGQIRLFCGLELEKYSQVCTDGYDYLIGSVHYLCINGQLVGMDRDLAAVQKVVQTHFGGDGLAYAKAYYQELATWPQTAKFDIIGHFDLVEKHAESAALFDPQSKEYLNAAFEAMDALQGRVPFFEVNTGAIARGYRTTPYPQKQITTRLLALGFLPVISSDCHDKNKLDCGFDLAKEWLKACGAKAHYLLTDQGFCAVSLE